MIVVIKGWDAPPYGQQYDYTPTGVKMGDTFHTIVLLQYFNPPRGTTNPWPIQLWSVNLRLINSSVVDCGLGTLMHGQRAKVTLEGTGFDLLTSAMAMITGQTMRVGLRSDN